MFGFMKKKDSSATPKAKANKSKGFYLELDEATGIDPKPAPLAAAPIAAPEAVVSPVNITPETPKVEPTPDPIAPAKTPKAKAATSKKAPEPAPVNEPVVVASKVPEPEILPAYLLLNNTPRRRPGANMAMFKDMAQQVKTTKD